MICYFFAVVGGIMQEIKKGQKSNCNGVILTNKEYKQYLKLNKVLCLFKEYKKEYDKTYYGYLW